MSTEATPDLNTKYQKLATEYAKLRSQVWQGFKINKEKYANPIGFELFTSLNENLNGVAKTNSFFFSLFFFLLTRMLLFGYRIIF